MNKTLIVALEVIGIILLIAIFYFIFFQKTLIIQTCEDLKDKVAKDNCYSIYTIYDKNINLAENIANKTQRDLIYVVIALLEKNSTICNEKINDIHIKNRCYKNLAKENSDITICDKNIKEMSERYDCYRIVSLTNKDPEVCSDFSDPTLADLCKGSPSGLNQLKPDFFKDPIRKIRSILGIQP